VYKFQVYAPMEMPVTEGVPPMGVMLPIWSSLVVTG
jgi:hypothetical protein